MDWIVEWGPMLVLWLLSMGYLLRRIKKVEKDVQERLDATLGPRKEAL